VQPRSHVTRARDWLVLMNTPAPDTRPLNNPVWESLNGAHAHVAIGTGMAKRYPREMSPFVAIADENDPQSWADLLELVGPGRPVSLSGRSVPAPEGWEVMFGGTGLQMTGVDVPGAPDPEAVPLTDDDVDAMVALVALTEPGPFAPRTIDFGGYLGIWRDGQLAAMAGHRMHPPGWVEISAVCTHPDFQRQGLSTRLVNACVANIRAQGDLPFLHVRETNEGAISVYRRLGFVERRRARFEQLRTPN